MSIDYTKNCLFRNKIYDPKSSLPQTFRNICQFLDNRDVSDYTLNEEAISSSKPYPIDKDSLEAISIINRFPFAQFISDAYAQFSIRHNWTINEFMERSKFLSDIPKTTEIWYLIRQHLSKYIEHVMDFSPVPQEHQSDQTLRILHYLPLIHNKLRGVSSDSRPTQQLDTIFLPKHLEQIDDAYFDSHGIQYANISNYISGEGRGIGRRLREFIDDVSSTRYCVLIIPNSSLPEQDTVYIFKPLRRHSLPIQICDYSELPWIYNTKTHILPDFDFEEHKAVCISIHKHRDAERVYLTSSASNTMRVFKHNLLSLFGHEDWSDWTGDFEDDFEEMGECPEFKDEAFDEFMETYFDDLESVSSDDSDTSDKWAAIDCDYNDWHSLSSNDTDLEMECDTDSCATPISKMVSEDDTCDLITFNVETEAPPEHASNAMDKEAEQETYSIFNVVEDSQCPPLPNEMNADHKDEDDELCLDYLQNIVREPMDSNAVNTSYEWISDEDSDERELETLDTSDPDIYIKRKVEDILRGWLQMKQDINHLMNVYGVKGAGASSNQTHPQTSNGNGDQQEDDNQNNDSNDDGRDDSNYFNGDNGNDHNDDDDEKNNDKNTKRTIDTEQDGEDEKKERELFEILFTKVENRLINDESLPYFLAPFSSNIVAVSVLKKMELAVDRAVLGNKMLFIKIVQESDVLYGRPEKKNQIRNVVHLFNDLPDSVTKEEQHKKVKPASKPKQNKHKKQNRNQANYVIHSSNDLTDPIAKEEENKKTKPPLPRPKKNKHHKPKPNQVRNAVHSSGGLPDSVTKEEPHKKPKSAPRSKQNKRQKQKQNHQAFNIHTPTHKTKPNPIYAPTSELTAKIIPNMIHEDIKMNHCKNNKKEPSVLFFMLKALTINAPVTIPKNDSIKIFNLGLHKQETKEPVYFIAERDPPDIKCAKHSKWKLDTILTEQQVQDKYGIAPDRLPNARHIKEEEMEKMKQRIMDCVSDGKLIETTKWGKIRVYKPRETKRRLTLSLIPSEFKRSYNEFVQVERKENMVLIPIVMFGVGSAWRIEYVWMIPMTNGGHIGVSFVHNKAEDTMEAVGIHLDKEFIFKQHQVLFPSSNLQDIFGNIDCRLDDMRIGNPDDPINKLNAKENELKLLKQKIKEMSENAFPPLPKQPISPMSSASLDSLDIDSTPMSTSSGSDRHNSITNAYSLSPAPSVSSSAISGGPSTLSTGWKFATESNGYH